MKNMKKKKRDLRTKEEIQKSNKNKTKIIVIMAIVLAILIIRPMITELFFEDKYDINGMFGNETDLCEEKGTEETIVEYVKGFMYGILQLEYPFFTKLLIFLGVVYLFNVILTISGDIIQLVLISGVAIFRISRWSYNKIRGREIDD